MRKTKVNLPDGSMVDGMEMDFDINGQTKFIIVCEDGSRLRFSLNITNVVRTPFQNPDGSPVYFINNSTASNCITVGTVPVDLPSIPTPPNLNQTSKKGETSHYIG